jgi:rhomboid protease GluP
MLGGLIPQARFATAMILMMNLGLYLACVVSDMQGGNGSAFLTIDASTLIRFGAKFNTAIALGQWWRLVTAGFLHGGLLHILMNMWVLYDLSAQVEEVYGQSRMLVIYFIATVCGFYASAWWSASVSVGASAALFGLIGAMFALGLRNRNATGDAIRSMYGRWIIYGLIFGLLPNLHVDNAAHIGGLVSGFAVAYFAGTPRFESNGSARAWSVGAWIAIAITAYCFLRMFLGLVRPSL